MRRPDDVPPRSRRVRLFISLGLLLVVAAGVLLVARYLTAHYERHSFVDGQPPPRYVSVQAGRTYWISVPGGVEYEKDLGQPPAALQCNATQRNGPQFTLDLAREGNDTKMVNAIASFRSPVTGRVHVTCVGLPDVYLDGTSSDPSGVLLVVGTVLLTVGVPILLSGLRSATAQRAERAVRP
ncbi:MAG TPA: hypothetical protein VFU35_13680 [Jatrophihabitans sp.]|nr:hypothetical protein [Jatrophihabitans sp.]